jgi:IclR family transcriptional regulator, KDG regulon repressor
MSPTESPSGGSSGESLSAARVLDILDLFIHARRELTLTNISEELGVPKSTAHGILHTMHRRGYLSRDPRSKAYSIGLRVVALAQTSQLVKTIQARAHPHLERLADELGETAVVGVFESEGVVYVDKAENSDAVRYTVPLGELRPLHATSIGKLYLATREEAEVRRLLASKRHGAMTDRTTTVPEQLLEELERVRAQGYSMNVGESIRGISAVAAPIHAHGDQLVAGLSVVGASERIAANLDGITPAVVATARRLSEELAT